MLKSVIVKLVTASYRYAWAVVFTAFVLAGAAGHYSFEHFAITTDTSQLISAKLPWRQREIQLDEAFPHHSDLIIAVIHGETSEAADGAARALVEALSAQTDKFAWVRRPDGGTFFENNGLLFLQKDDIQRTTEQLIRAQPFLATLAADPTLRGLATALSYIPRGIQAGEIKAEDFAPQFNTIAGQIEDLMSWRKSSFSWSQLFTGAVPAKSDLWRFVNIKPKLNYGALEPGAQACDAIREAVADLGLRSDKGVTVRLTGPVPMADEEFGTVAEGALFNGVLTIAAVLLLLWLALHSTRIILAVMIALFVGLSLTAAAGLAMVGTLNLISVAFAVLFVGIGVDFGIQFSVRYREERHIHDALSAALSSAAAEAGKPLVLAAAATAAGFYAFLPTDYRGVSELGLIAGTGMLIALFTSVTLLPALLKLLNPPGEPAAVGYRWLAPVDRFLARFRIAILGLTAIAVIAGLPLLARLRFDFNPLNLRSTSAESVATMLDIMKDPAKSPNTIDILVPNLEAAKNVAAKLDGLPEVARTLTLQSFVPEHQEEKLAIITDAAALLGPTLTPPEQKPAPPISETVQALLEVSEALAAVPNDSAKRLGHVLDDLARANPRMMKSVEGAMMPALRLRLEQIRNSLKAAPVTIENLPPEITGDWIAGDGRARVEVAPSGDSNDTATLERFASAVLKIAPEATGTPILIQESAKTVVRAFAEAALLALVSITVILFVALRRVSDVLLTLIPLLLAGVVTLELTVLLKLPFNFANIIALPLILGVGVAFKIYYVLAWRGGETSLLASSLTRAVFFSAMTTATAFGSLWFSHHPGTSSMGKLLSLSLVTTLAAAVLFQPILMGPPRQSTADAEGGKDGEKRGEPVGAGPAQPAQREPKKNEDRAKGGGLGGRIAAILVLMIGGYLAGAYLGYAAIEAFSGNVHDRSVEAATTAVIVAGPLGALVALIAALLRLRSRS